MLRRDERADAVHVGRRIAAGEGRPEKVVQRRGGELAVVDDHHQRETLTRRCDPTPAQNGATAPRPRRALSRIRRPLDRQHAGKAEPRIRETVGQAELGSSVGRCSPRAGRRDHELRTLVQAAPRIVERVDRRAGLKVQVASASRPVPAGAAEMAECRECRATGRLRGPRSASIWPATTVPGRARHWPA